MQYSCIPRRSRGEFSTLLYKLHRTPAAREHHDRHSPRRPMSRRTGTPPGRSPTLPVRRSPPGSRPLTPTNHPDLLPTRSDHPTPPPLDIHKNHNSPRTFPQPITLQPLTTIQPIHLTPRQNGFFPLPNCPRYTAPDPRKNPENTLSHCHACACDANRPLFHNEHSLCVLLA